MRFNTNYKVANSDSVIFKGILRNSDSKKIRTREKPGPELKRNPDSCLKKPGLDF